MPSAGWRTTGGGRRNRRGTGSALHEAPTADLCHPHVCSSRRSIRAEEADRLLDIRSSDDEGGDNAVARTPNAIGAERQSSDDVPPGYFDLRAMGFINPSDKSADHGLLEDWYFKETRVPPGQVPSSLPGLFGVALTPVAADGSGHADLATEVRRKGEEASTTRRTIQVGRTQDRCRALRRALRPAVAS